MTERHPPLRKPQLEHLAAWHPNEDSPEKVGVGCAIEATERHGFLSSGAPEGH